MIREEEIIDSVDLQPDVSRIMEGLRDTGYNFNTAISDIVDNSIAAHATQVRIRIDQMLDGSIRVSISDNGCGMTKEGLMAAMRYGAPARPDIHSLGKFGLGLKTASTSCCRRLKVCSRANGGADILCAVWDLDYIARAAGSHSAWTLVFVEPAGDDLDDFEVCAGEGPGTCVVWENCDRILSKRYRNPNSSTYRNALQETIECLRFHLSMTFQRFLDPDDARADTVEMCLNGEPVQAWDPFCSEFDRTYYGDDTVAIECDGVQQGEIKLRYFVVPHKENFQDADSKRRIMPGFENKALDRRYSEEALSGFYIYRENRLIHWGEWFGFEGIDFHHKLCRFELSFGAELDEYFQVDIKKSRIQVSGDLKSELKKSAAPAKNAGKNAYRYKKKKMVEEASQDIHETSNASICSLASKGLGALNAVEVLGDNLVKIQNQYGEVEAEYSVLRSYPDSGGKVALVLDEDIEGGLLWAPSFLPDGSQCVSLSPSHEFYQRFYVLNKDNQLAIQAMDYVLWALAQAELSALSDDAKENLEDARFCASRLLRKLSKMIPDVSLDDMSNGDEA